MQINSPTMGETVEEPRTLLSRSKRHAFVPSFHTRQRAAPIEHNKRKKSRRGIESKKWAKRDRVERARKGDRWASLIITWQIVPVKAAIAVGKNHKVLLMMMTATTTSAATASAATTTSGLGSILGRSHFKLILCCFLPNSCPHNKFHPNRTKNLEVKKICYWSALVGRSGQSKNSRSHFKLILCCFLPNSCPHNKFHPN